MDHGLGLIIGMLEILEIEVFIIPIILEILGISVFQFLVSWKYWKSQFFNFPGILEVLKTFFAGGRAGGRGPGAAEPSVGPGGGDGLPTTLPSGQTPGPSRPGTKYPVRGQSLTSTITPPEGIEVRDFN